MRRKEFKGKIVLVVDPPILDRALSAQEIALLYKRPYCFLRTGKQGRAKRSTQTR